MQIRTACVCVGNIWQFVRRLCIFFASVAQLAEQRIRNAQVAGSIPAGSSMTDMKKEPVRILLCRFFCFLSPSVIVK